MIHEISLELPRLGSADAPAKYVQAIMLQDMPSNMVNMLAFASGEQKMIIGASILPLAISDPTVDLSLYSWNEMNSLVQSWCEQSLDMQDTIREQQDSGELLVPAVDWDGLLC